MVIQTLTRQRVHWTGKAPLCAILAWAQLWFPGVVGSRFRGTQYERGKVHHS